MQFTKSDLELFISCTRNIYEFAKYARVLHPVLGDVRFDLYPFQKRVLWEFLHNRFNIILKARQMGITEVIGLYVLWLALFHINKNIVIVSLKERVAKRFLRRIKYIYKNLPPVLQVPIINGRKSDFGTVQEMEFVNGSIISSIPTTEDAGRSEAVSLLILDETAIMSYADLIWAAAAPTLFTGGSAILNSTPYGVGNFYHNQWVDALTGANGFNAIQIPWHLHPDRDEKWYLQMRAVLGTRRAAQEIDCDFLASGDNVFDPMDLKAMQDALVDYPVIHSELEGNLLVFEWPKSGELYFLGGDVSTGRARDYSTFSIMDKAGDEKVCFKGRIPTNKYRDLVGTWGLKYNQAKVGIEANDIGEGVVMGLEESGYPNLYYTIRMLKERGASEPKIEKIPGWYTTSKNRPIIIDTLERDIREETVNIKNPFFIAEGYTFIYDEANRPVALSKGEYMGEGSNTYSDDSIMGECITNWLRKGKENVITSTPV